MLGSAAVTLGVGLLGYRLSRRRILLGSAALMLLTGIGFAGLTTFWPMMVVAVAGTLNPSSGDVSVFLPTEQAALAHTVGGPARTMTFAGYNLVGSLAGAVGALASGVPALAAARWGVSPLRAERGVFVFYALCAVVAAIVYERLSPALEIHAEKRAAHPLAESRAVVLGGDAQGRVRPGAAGSVPGLSKRARKASVDAGSVARSPHPMERQPDGRRPARVTLTKRRTAVFEGKLPAAVRACRQ